jgi:hypothetical protein
MGGPDCQNGALPLPVVFVSLMKRSTGPEFCKGSSSEGSMNWNETSKKIELLDIVLGIVTVEVGCTGLYALVRAASSQLGKV